MTGIALTVLLLVGCRAPAMLIAPTPTPIPPTATPTAIPPTPTFTPLPGPKAGHWAGEDVSFLVTEDGQIQNLGLSFPFAGSTCTYETSPGEDIPIVDNTLEYNVTVNVTSPFKGTATVFTITGIFETETTFSGSYSVSMCDDLFQFKPDSDELLFDKGTWTAIRQ